MKLIINNMKNIIIYNISNLEYGITDKDINILNKLNKFSCELIIVCNFNNIKNEVLKYLKSITQNIVFTNKNHDRFYGYKLGIEYVGFEKIKEYDLLTLINNNIYGPFISFDEIFDTMSNKNFDFWSITKNYFEVDDVICDYLESYFLTFNKSIIKSNEFENYWKYLEYRGSDERYTHINELSLIKYFLGLGFSKGTFVQQDDLIEDNFNQTMFLTYELIKYKKCPFLVKDIFTSYTNNVSSQLYHNTGQNILKTINYIKNSTDYDIDLIFDDLLKTVNLSDIVDSLNLNYFLSNTQSKLNYNVNKKVALFIHLYHEDLVDDIFSYAKNMPCYSDIIVTTPNTKIKDKIESYYNNINVKSIKVVICENKGRDVGALLVALKKYVFDYDYVCFVHGKKSNQTKPYTIGKSFYYKCIDNLLKSREYIENIIYTLDNDKRLGLLFPQPPMYSLYLDYFVGNEWSNNYNNTLHLLNLLNINVPISNNKQPICPIGSMLWFKVDAIKNIFNYNWSYDDFPKEPMLIDGTISHAIERVYGFIAQYNGYYSAYILNDEFSKIELTNLKQLLRESDIKFFKN